MDEKQRKLISKLNILSGTTKPKKLAASSGGSHQMTLPQSDQKEEYPNEILDSISTEYQLTVRTRMQLTRRQIGLLLEDCNYRAVCFGVNLGLYLTMEHLSTQLIGQKSNTIEIRDEKERRVCSVTQIILQSLGNTSLLIEEDSQIPEVIREEIISRQLIVSSRVFGSRHQIWNPEGFIRILAVPLSTQFDRVKGISERYSSYCKGYGESHPSAHYKKTKPSSELDGEPQDREYLTLSNISELLVLVQLETRAKFLRRGKS